MDCSLRSLLLIRSRATLGVIRQQTVAYDGVLLNPPSGDTISAAALRNAIEQHLAATSRSRLAVGFLAAERTLDWDSAMAWIDDARQDGCDLVRYILLEQQSGDLLVDLVAIASLNSDLEPPAV